MRQILFLVDIYDIHVREDRKHTQVVIFRIIPSFYINVKNIIAQDGIMAQAIRHGALPPHLQDAARLASGPDQSRHTLLLGLEPPLVLEQLLVLEKQLLLPLLLLLLLLLEELKLLLELLLLMLVGKDRLLLLVLPGCALHALQLQRCQHA